MDVGVEIQSVYLQVPNAVYMGLGALPPVELYAAGAHLSSFV
jgi:hypothetical protein